MNESRQGYMFDLEEHLTKSLWNPELEHALERFSIPIYLDWYDEDQYVSLTTWSDLPEHFLNYLEGEVSNPCS